MAAHVVALLMLTHAGIPSSDLLANGTDSVSARDSVVTVKLSSFSADIRSVKTPDIHRDPAPVQAATTQLRKRRSDERVASRSVLRPHRRITTSGKSLSPIMPLLANPLGQGSWGFARSAPVVQDEAALSRIQQEHAALRMALMDRLSVWMGQQMQQHRDSNCVIRYSQDSRQARLSCTPVATEGLLWPALAGLAIPGEPRPENMICIEVGRGRLRLVDCAQEPVEPSDER